MIQHAKETVREQAEEIVLKPRHRFALVLLTNRCNLACKHCYVESGPKGHEGLLIDRALRLVDELHEEFGSMFLSLSGGEALVRTEDCFQVLERSAQKHKVQLISNGTLIDDDIARRLADLDISMKISLDGSRPKTHDWMRGKGTFDATMRGIDRLLRAGFPASRLAFGATIPVDVESEVDELLDLATSLGVERVRFDSVAKIGRARVYWPHSSGPDPDPDSESLRDYFNGEFQRKHSPQWRLINLNDSVGMFETLHIYYQGEVHLYLNYDHPITKEGCIGNLYDNSLREILSSPRVSEAILRKFLRFARMPARSFISYYSIRESPESQLWFQEALPTARM